MSKYLVIVPGTFNPFTKAHCEMGRLASEKVLSDNPGAEADVIFVPGSTSFMKDWGKEPGRFLSDEERIACIEESLKESADLFPKHVNVSVSDIETKAAVSGATIDTVSYLRGRCEAGYDGVYLCLGADKLGELAKWKCAEELFESVTTVMFTRSSDRNPVEAVLELTKAGAQFFCGGRKMIPLCLDMGGVSSTSVRTAWYEDRLEEVRDSISAYNYELLKSRQFDVENVTAKLLEWLRDWFDKNGRGCNAVIGISGGKDSTVAAAVCTAALGKDRVIGVMMPNGVQPDICDSKRVCEVLGIKNYEVNIHDAVEGVYSALSACDGLEISTQSRVNLPPRIRMSTLYAVSQSSNGRVINTCNLSEDWVGYSTRYGDSVGDVSPLSHLTVREVKAIGKYLGVPAELIDKTPSDGLCGRSDEDNLGFTYAMLDRYIRTGDCEDAEKRALIDRKHAANLFKLQLMPSFEF